MVARRPRHAVRGKQSPNNGVTETSFARRRSWDAQIDAFLKARPARGSTPLIWLGDLNVACAWDDVGCAPPATPPDATTRLALVLQATAAADGPSPRA